MINQLKTREQLAFECGISTKTMQRRLKEAGYNIGKRLLKPEEQEKIITLIFGNKD
jgi:hypothetical protein